MRLIIALLSIIVLNLSGGTVYADDTIEYQDGLLSVNIQELDIHSFAGKIKALTGVDIVLDESIKNEKISITAKQQKLSKLLSRGLRDCNTMMIYGSDGSLVSVHVTSKDNPSAMLATSLPSSLLPSAETSGNPLGLENAGNILLEESPPVAFLEPEQAKNLAGSPAEDHPPEALQEPVISRGQEPVITYHSPEPIVTKPTEEPEITTNPEGPLVTLFKAP